MVEITLPIVLQIVQTAGILVGIVYYLTIMRNAQRSRQTEMLWRLYESRNNEQANKSWTTILALTWDDFEDYMEKFGAVTGHPEISAQVLSQINFMDGLAKLVEENVVDVNTVYNMFGDRILIAWFKYETIVKAFRGSYGLGSDYCTSFESLADEMMRIKKQKGLPLPIYYLHPTSELHQVLT